MANEKNLKGVGGWLALLVIGLIFLGPLLSITKTYSALNEAEALYPHLTENQHWGTLKAYTWVVIVLQLSITISAGIRLQSNFKRDSVQYAIRCLWLGGPALTVLSTFGDAIITGTSLGDVWANAETIKGLVQGLMTAGVWTAYLKNSKRVNNTYIL